jgi:hypothetical protein
MTKMVREGFDRQKRSAGRCSDWFVIANILEDAGSLADSRGELTPARVDETINISSTRVADPIMAAGARSL